MLSASLRRGLQTQQGQWLRHASVSAQSLGLDRLGVNNTAGIVHHNLSYDEIADHETRIDTQPPTSGRWASNGSFAIDTGKFTGRSPKDKYFVEQKPSSDNIWWGDINKPMQQDVFDSLYGKVTEHYSKLNEFYVFDGFCGASEASRMNVRFLTLYPWQHHFVRNMFIRPNEGDLDEGFEPDFTIINACDITNENWQEQGLNSENFVAFNMEDRVAIIGGTRYGGEMKKGIFSCMNYQLPLSGVMAMHCSANKGQNGDTALFFGLSGTGKTTLSADPHRFLIGDDEHGWDDDGIFNFEGGCYAKTINLREESEPEIYRAIKRDALLENVTFDADNNPDYDDVSKTQNGRVSYPIYHIPNYEPSGQGGHPNNVIFLTCDAYGVLPPVSKLTEPEAMFHFLSGYTAKVAGTERGVTEPEATFSACFGAAFLPLHPTKYAELLEQKLLKHNSSAYLVNTGWSGGPYGVGERMSISATRACIDAILDGTINDCEFESHPVFKFQVPKELPGVDPDVLNARATWPDPAEYDRTAAKLAHMFQDNYKQFIAPGLPDYSAHGPSV